MSLFSHLFKVYFLLMMISFIYQSQASLADEDPQFPPAPPPSPIQGAPASGEIPYSQQLPPAHYQGRPDPQAGSVAQLTENTNRLHMADAKK